ncbi:MAG: hypothetical protein K2N74_00990, partial [Clostridiales bacterium]|nr:hypothetical protein [Clostridiales bacterium]
MKSRVKKVGLSILVGCATLVAAIGGAALLRDGNPAKADGGANTTVTFAADKTELVAGGKFELTVTVESLRDNTNLVWSAHSFYIGALKSDGKTYDGNIAQYLTVTAHAVKELEEFVDYNDTSSYYYKETLDEDNQWVSGEFTSKNDANALLLSTNTMPGKSLYSANQFIYQLTITLAKDYDVENYGTFTFGMHPLSKNGVKVYNEVAETMFNDYADTGAFAATNTLTFTVREASEDNTLADLEVGHSSDTSLTSLKTTVEPIKVPDAAEYTSNNEALNTFVVKPTATDENAKIEVALNQQLTFTEVTSASVSDPLTLADPSTLTGVDHNVLYVKVTAENGDEKTYTVTVKIGYVRLGAITASASTPTTGVTKNGLDLSETTDKAYDKDKTEYNVFIPSDFDTDAGVTLSASVLTGYGASTTVALSGTGCEIYTADGSATATELTSAGTVLLKT